MGGIFILFFIFFSAAGVADPIHVEITGQSLEGVSSGSDMQLFGEAELQQTMSSDLAEFLRRKGFSLQRQGGNGQISSLYLRGADADHVQVLIDGVAVNDASNPDRRFDLSKIPLSEVRRVEIIKGPQTVRYGSQALGGVIRIWTQATQEKQSYTIGANAGSFNSYELHGSGLQPLGSNFSLGLSGQHYETDGYSAASGGRERDGHRSQSGAASLSYNLENLRSQYSFRRVNQVTDLDRGGGAANDDPNFIAHFRQDTHSLITSVFPSNTFNYQLLVGHSKLERHADNFADSQSNVTAQGDYLGEQSRAELSLEKKFFESTTVVGGLEFSQEKAEGISDFSIFPESEAEKTDAFLVLSQGIGSWSFDAGARAEDHSEFGSAWSTELGGGYQLTKSQNLKARYAEATKWPSLFELYDPTYGNVNLEPEKSRAIELGWSLQTSTWGIATTAFETEFRNLITLAPVSFRSINEGKARVRGLELDLNFIKNDWMTQAKYQFLEPRQTETDTELLRRSRHEILISETYQKETWEVGLWYKYNSKRADIDPVSFSRTTLPSYWIWGGSFAYNMNKIKIWGKIENLSQRTYEEVAGYRAPPRSFLMGATFETN